MKKAVAIIITLLSLSVFCSAGLTVFAAENTTYTYTLSVDDNWIRTQDAFVQARCISEMRGFQSRRTYFTKRAVFMLPTAATAEL